MFFPLFNHHPSVSAPYPSTHSQPLIFDPLLTQKGVEGQLEEAGLVGWIGQLHMIAPMFLIGHTRANQGDSLAGRRTTRVRIKV